MNYYLFRIINYETNKCITEFQEHEREIPFEINNNTIWYDSECGEIIEANIITHYIYHGKREVDIFVLI